MYSENEILEIMCFDTSNVTFQQVCGYPDIKRHLSEIIHDSPNGHDDCKVMFLYGHPGVGKTLFLRAIATEAGAKLLVCSPYLMRAGRNPMVTPESIKTVFDVAHKNGPSILCFEDIHVLWNEHEGNLELKEEFFSQLKQYQTQRLKERQHGGVGSNILAVILVSASPWLFDPELIRGFKLIHIDMPSKETRRELIKFHLRDTTFKLTNEELNELSEKTAGFTGSDICCLARDATMEKVRQISRAKFFKKTLVSTVEPTSTKGEHNSRCLSTSSTVENSATTSAVEKQTGPLDVAVQEDKGQRGQRCESTLVEKFTPCLASDEGAIETTLWDLDPEMIQLSDPQVTFREMVAAISKSSASIAARELVKMTEFNSKVDSCG